jgi:hypothetical protein
MTTLTTNQPPPIETCDLVTCVEVTNDQTPGLVPKDCYHFLYASELYGTIFGVYGRFTFNKRPASDDVEVTGLTMRLLNYKGLLNIGFLNERPSYNHGLKVVNFKVRGGGGKDYIELPFGDPSTRPVIKKGGRFQLTFNRILVPLVGPPERNADPRRPIGTVPNQLDPLFDTEFRERDGIDQYHRVLRDGMGEKSEAKLVAHRCLTSVVNLIY